MKLEDLPEVDVRGLYDYSDGQGALDWSLYPDGLARSARGLEVLTYERVSEGFRSLDLRNSTKAKLAAIGFTEGPVYDALAGMTTSSEGPDHRQMRRAFQPWFIADNVEKFRNEICTMIDQWLADRSEGVVDFGGELGGALPAMVFTKIVGASPNDQDFISRVSAEIIKFPTFDPSVHDDVETGVLDMIDWLDDLVEHKKATPGADLTSALLQAERDGIITRSHTVRIMITLIIASVDSTRSQMGCDLFTLAANKDQWRRLRGNPDMIGRAVAELYRYNPIVLTSSRYSETDIDLYGLHIEAYEPVALNVFTANNDPKAFDRPRELDVLAERPRASFSFGNGRHSCVGRMVATIEQEELLRSVLKHWDDFDVLESSFFGAPFGQSPVDLTFEVTPRKV